MKMLKKVTRQVIDDVKEKSSSIRREVRKIVEQLKSSSNIICEKNKEILDCFESFYVFLYPYLDKKEKENPLISKFKEESKNMGSIFDEILNKINEQYSDKIIGLQFQLEIIESMLNSYIERISYIEKQIREKEVY
ncbi:MAG: hypothetical protein GF317_05775 [Candidatus Lokiarchaeota archaeon]|nr:hypothetical protein [Candidatus Lokiarchaeota archaeon]